MGSVDTSISDLVTIVVKAPNQQISDQTIQCNVDWSIKRLKDYLSEVYPSQPKIEEQKLIYSGKLLTDSAVLKDVLRTYEGQENHTVHLVCTSKAQKMSNMFTNSSSTNSTRNFDNSNTTPSADVYRNVTQPPHIQNLTANSTNVPINRTPSAFIDQMNVNNFASNSFNPRYFWPTSTAFINVNDVHANQQFAYMQQVYAQYVSQYMQMMGQPGFGYLASHVPQPVSRDSQFSTLPNANMMPQDRINGEGNQIRDNQPVAAAAGGNDVDEEDGRNNRDWLDWFYVCSRMIVLFSVVYFYSTPLRLLAVLLLVCMFYLHQNMRLHNEHVNINNNNNNNAINHNDQNNENRPAFNDAEAADNLRQRRPQQETPNTPNPVADTPATPASNDQVSSPTEIAATPIPERPSPIAITLLAIRTFFLSLVPDQPTL